MKVYVYRDIPYLDNGNEGKTTYDIYSPDNNQSNLLIWVHGGAWVSGDKEEFSEPARNLAERYGITTVVLNYRVSPRPSETLISSPIQHPIHTQDCLRGILHVVSNLETFNIKVKNVYLGGHSAGGQIAGLLTFNPYYIVTSDLNSQYPHWKTIISNIKGIFVTEGIFDLESFAKHDSSYAPNYIIPGFGEGLNNWVEASPQNINFNKAQELWSISKPRYHFIHSKADRLVDPLQSSTFNNTLKNLGFEGSYELLDLGTHDDVPLSDTALQRLANFVNL